MPLPLIPLLVVGAAIYGVGRYVQSKIEDINTCSCRETGCDETCLCESCDCQDNCKCGVRTDQTGTCSQCGCSIQSQEKDI